MVSLYSAMSRGTKTLAKSPPGRPIRPDDLDAVIHERVRLSIVSALAGRRKVKYLELRSILELTDGNLAGHIRVLEKAGYELEARHRRSVFKDGHVMDAFVYAKLR